MQLNIKNPETVKLARELATMEGTSISNVVMLSLKQRKDALLTRRSSLSSEEKVAALMEISRRAAQLPIYDERAADDLLYDDLGLPKE